MMFGYSDEWFAVFFVPVVLWLLCGPFLMGALGVWYARQPGWKARLTAVLLPAVPVVTVTVNAILPTDSWDEETFVADLVGTLLVYVGLITLLPWLLGFLLTRLTYRLRARRSGDSARD
ncbi:hypothetical protein F4556_000487 [Kitasatospora gansuensis]|uniref:Uncharacterized protein n=1 Tax=Kitasatospora gansuensis TaxID=258050 RepID=A0A7W7WEN5_9ACTN|nr:hypothetical protein [Kitasatospora gansuensis]MBB4944952.1 hypothetical protein [Kitasatospora gansuensis]